MSINILMILFYPLLVISTFLIGLTTSLFAMYSIYLIFFKRKIQLIKNNKIIIGLIIFWSYIIIRSFFAEDISLSLEASLFYGRFIFFAIGLSYLLNKKEDRFYYFSLSLILVFFILSIDSLIQFLIGYNLIGIKQFHVARVSSFFGDELILGSFISRLFPILLLCILFSIKKTSTKSYLLYYFIFISPIIIYISGERSAIFNIFLSYFVIFILIRDLRKYFLRSIFFIFICIFLITLLNKEVYQRNIQNTFNQLVSGDGGEFSIQPFSQMHKFHYQTSLLMFKDNIIFGQGPKMFRVLCKNDKYNPITSDKLNKSVTGDVQNACTTHTHHTYIQLLSETGIIGAVFFIFIFIYACYFLLKKFYFLNLMNNNKHLHDEEKYMILIFICVLINLWPLLPSGNFFGSYLNIFYYIPLALYLYFNNKNIGKNSIT